jgi:hypothetical protein
MDNIICKCGNTVQLDYNEATIIAYKNTDGTIVDRYCFCCGQCGQPYHRKVPKSIKLEKYD